MQKLLLLSTWGSQCGIATYTEQLVAAAMGGHDPSGPQLAITVGVPPAADGRVDVGLPDVPTTTLWSREVEDGGLLAVEHVRRVGYDVVHIQHEDGLFQNRNGFVAMVRSFASFMDCPQVYITLHTVQRGHAAFYRTLAQCATLIVHTTDAALYLAHHGIRNFVTIPHGTPEPYERPTQKLARNRLCEKFGVAPEGVLAVTLGFMGPNKNVVGSMLGFAEARVPTDGCYFVAGRCHPSYDRSVGWATQQIFDDALHVYPSFVEDCDVPTVMSAADFCVLNSTADTLSASGQVHLCAAYGRPLLAARKPIYADALRAGAVTFDAEGADPSREFVDGLEALYASSALREVVARNMADYGMATRWPRIYRRYYKRLWGAA